MGFCRSKATATGRTPQPQAGPQPSATKHRMTPDSRNMIRCDSGYTYRID